MSIQAIALRPFIPSGPDYGRALAFWQALGCAIDWQIDGLAQLRLGDATFLLQDFHNREMAENLMIYLQVASLDACWQQVETSGVLATFPQARASAPKMQPWGQRELHLIDLAGVCWHFAE